MSQTFHLCLATDTLAADAQTLGVTIEDLQSIQVEVIVTLAQTNQIAQTAQITRSAQQPEWRLQLDYHITLPLKSLAAQLDWPTWQPTQVGFADYLWEQTCLECFLAGGLITDRLINNSASINDINEIGIDGVDANKQALILKLMPIQMVVMRFTSSKAIVILRHCRQRRFYNLMGKHGRLLTGQPAIALRIMTLRIMALRIMTLPTQSKTPYQRKSNLLSSNLLSIH